MVKCIPDSTTGNDSDSIVCYSDSDEEPMFVSDHSLSDLDDNDDDNPPVRIFFNLNNIKVNKITVFRVS